MKDKSVSIDTRGPVTTVTMRPMAEIFSRGFDIHADLADALEAVQRIAAVRVVVLTGSGSEFLAAPPLPRGGADSIRHRFSDPAVAWRVFSGIIRTHKALTQMDLPVVAKVNGDAVGFGLGLVLASDFAVASEDARFSDHHMALDEQAGSDRMFSLVPGDGVGALAPLYVTPSRAKQLLMLGEQVSAFDLAAQGIITRAVPPADVGVAVDQLVARLMRRSRYTLGWTKRIVNTAVAARLNESLDASAGYELASILLAGAVDEAEREA